MKYAVLDLTYRKPNGYHFRFLDVERGFSRSGYSDMLASAKHPAKGNIEDWAREQARRHGCSVLVIARRKFPPNHGRRAVLA